MSWKRVISVLLTAAVLPAICKAEVNRSWESLVQSAQVGKKVVVIRMNAGQVEGKLLSINSDAIAVEQHGVREEIQRANVFRVRYANIRRRHTLLGLAIGAGAGIAIGAGAGANSGYQGAVALGMGLLGVGVGSAVGGALPIGAPLYEANQPRISQIPNR